MKQNQVLKSLDELSSELLVPEAPKTAETTPGQSELVTSETKQTLQPLRLLTGADARAYRGWGINE